MTFPRLVPYRPSAVGVPVAAGRRGIDALTVLTVYLVLLFAFPSSLTITALGSAGRPASLWALAALLWWGWFQVQRQTPSGWGAQPVRWTLFVFLAIALVSYAVAMLRGLPGDETSPADNGILRLAAWAGILLVANDGLGDAEDLRKLLRRISWAGALLSLLGIAQFLTGNSLLDWITIPGMSFSSPALSGLDMRAGFIRASATASHPLEYGVALCIAFPIALTLALEDKSRQRVLRWLPVAVISVASVLSVSRSTLIGLVAAILVLLPSLTRRVRVLLALSSTVLVVVVGLAVPGLLGTLRGLFTGIAEDPSTLSRTNSYDVAAELVARFPLVGKGFGTLLARYHIFDNEYLLLSIELGILGLLAFLALEVTAVLCAALARSATVTRLDRQLSSALQASAVAGALLMAFFDGFSFPIAVGMLFLMFGLCGAAKRLFTDPSRPALPLYWDPPVAARGTR